MSDHNAPQPAPATTPSSHPAVARVGKYLMLDLLGEGAFGKVRLAVDETTGKEYAMKIMDKSHIKANELTLQVRREIAVMKAMRHPNIVNLHEVLTSSKNLYMVMDLVTGGELFDAVAAEGRLPEDRTRSYFQQLVDGVDYCHSRRVYHRDLKPENLLLSGDKHTLKITDFGLSSIKAQNASTELLHTIMGSPHYIAPEIITSAADGYEGSKVDVWAAGVILFGMLAGFLPFDHSNTRDLYRAIVHSPVKYPPHFSYDVVKLLRSLLQKDPSKRPSMTQVKAFAWFKVNYEPAVVPEAKPSTSGSIGPRKKSKNKNKRSTDRLNKKKTKDPNARTSESSAKDATEGNMCTSHGTLDEPCNYSLDFKPLSRLFADSKGTNSASHHAQVQHASTPVDSIQSPPDQENVDPGLCKDSLVGGHGEYEHVQTSLEMEPSRPSLSKDQWRPDATAEHPVSYVEATHRLGISDCAQSVDENPKVTMENTPQKIVIESVEMLSPDDSNVASVNPFTDTDDNQSMRVPLEPEHLTTPVPVCDSISCLKTPKANGAPSVKDAQSLSILSSPLSPEVKRFPTASPNSSYPSPGERRQESIRFAGHRPTEKPSPNTLVSPISLRTRVSSGSLLELDNKKLSLSSDYRSLAPQLLGSLSDDGVEEASEESRVIANEENKTESEKEIRRLGSISPVADTPRSRTEEEGIFKPIKAVFAPLVEQVEDKHAGPSMWASVFCPEFDYDADGCPQWCIDNMEVFADVEGEEMTNRGKTAKGWTSKIMEEAFKQRQHSIGDESEKSKNVTSIFAPLDNDLAIKLSPFSKNVETNPFM